LRDGLGLVLERWVELDAADRSGRRRAPLADRDSMSTCPGFQRTRVTTADRLIALATGFASASITRS
jgi:hypothetical protein